MTRKSIFIIAMLVFAIASTISINAFATTQGHYDSEGWYIDDEELPSRYGSYGYIVNNATKSNLYSCHHSAEWLVNTTEFSYTVGIALVNAIEASYYRNFVVRYENDDGDFEATTIADGNVTRTSTKSENYHTTPREVTDATSGYLVYDVCQNQHENQLCIHHIFECRFCLYILRTFGLSEQFLSPKFHLAPNYALFCEKVQNLLESHQN